MAKIGSTNHYTENQKIEQHEPHGDQVMNGEQVYMT